MPQVHLNKINVNSKKSKHLWQKEKTIFLVCFIWLFCCARSLRNCEMLLQHGDTHVLEVFSAVGPQWNTTIQKNTKRIVICHQGGPVPGCWEKGCGGSNWISDWKKNLFLSMVQAKLSHRVSVGLLLGCLSYVPHPPASLSCNGVGQVEFLSSSCLSEKKPSWGSYSSHRAFLAGVEWQEFSIMASRSQKLYNI